MTQIALNALLEVNQRLLELSLQARLRPFLEFLLDNLDPAMERFELRGRGEQLFELLFIGVRLALLIGVGRLLVLLEEITQLRLARLDPFSHPDYGIQR